MNPNSLKGLTMNIADYFHTLYLTLDQGQLPRYEVELVVAEEFSLLVRQYENNGEVARIILVVSEGADGPDRRHHVFYRGEELLPTRKLNEKDPEENQYHEYFAFPFSCEDDIEEVVASDFTVVPIGS